MTQAGEQVWMEAHFPEPSGPESESHVEFQVIKALAPHVVWRVRQLQTTGDLGQVRLIDVLSGITGFREDHTTSAVMSLLSGGYDISASINANKGENSVAPTGDIPPVLTEGRQVTPEEYYPTIDAVAQQVFAESAA